MTKISGINLRVRDAFGAIDARRPSRSMRTSVVVPPLSNRLDLIGYAELFENTAPHAVHSRQTDSGLFRDLFVGKSLSHVLHQPVFACRERPTTQTTMPGRFATRWWLRDLGFPAWDEK